VPKQVEFPSLVPLIHGRAREQHDAMFCWYRGFQRSVRTREHKLIVYLKAGVTQLFDLGKDPWETKDVAASPKYAAVKKNLQERLQRFERELGDDMQNAE
jgi:arylsulfatase A-like enzyme